MHWDSDHWIIDLDTFIPYWKTEAEAQRIPVVTLWKRILSQQLFGHGPDEIQTPLALEQLPIYAVWDRSPFRALLLLSHMKHTQATGWILPGSARYQQLWTSITWDTWESVARQVLEHWDHRKPKGFNRSRVQHSLHRLRLTAERLALKPSQLDRLPIEGIQRRYGPWIARLCQWILDPKSIRNTPDFPWETWYLSPRAQCQRHLDNPTRKWAECTQELIDDLDKIAHQTTAKITELEWLIRFTTEDTLRIPIRFRTPHALRTEQGTHRTALLQLMGAFTTATKGRRQTPYISGWHITITGTLSMGIDRLTLFEWSPDAEHQRQLDALANQVLTPLIRYQWAPHWTPGSDFNAIDQVPHHDLPHLSAILPHAGVSRPLFTVTTPYEFRLPKHQASLEAVMMPWWQQPASTNSSHERYHRHKDSNNRWLWVAQHGGKSEVRGIYA